MLATVCRTFRRVQYNLRGGFLVRPLVIAIALACFGTLIPAVEERYPLTAIVLKRLSVVAPHDAQTAQGLLATIAGSIMTVVSIVLSVLLIALTLASIQFSPRLLNGFVRDRLTQYTLGAFLGTFLYCLCAYSQVRLAPDSPVPTFAVLVALMLAVLCVAFLIIFINHISKLINANYIVDRIASETEAIVDAVLPNRLTGAIQPEPAAPDGLGRGSPVISTTSGYIQYIDGARLLALAKQYGEILVVQRRVGQFIPAGKPLLRFTTRTIISPEASEEFLRAFDNGVVRTMEQDIEFGVLQLVDIALKAISPAVNDPSTAISCIDQLSRILVRIVSRQPVAAHLYRPPGVLRVVLSPMPFARLLDVAFTQIRHYGKGDMAVCVRLLRALGDIASATQHAVYLDEIGDHAQRIATACLANFPEDECSLLRARLDMIIRYTRHV